MTRNKADKKRLKRKEKAKQHRIQQTHAVRGDKLDFFFSEAKFYLMEHQYDAAVESIKKALQIAPNHIELLLLLGHCGEKLTRSDLLLQALQRLYRLGALEEKHWARYCQLLLGDKQFEEAANHIRYRDNIAMIDALKKQIALENPPPRKSKIREKPAEVTPVRAIVTAAIPEPAQKLPQIPVAIEFDSSPLEEAWAGGGGATPDLYALAMDGYRIRLNETFDHLVCINRLNEVRSLWYQEETAKKVLKRFRGRALLADEVRLGKTIEALMVFSEYYLRGMVKGGLILTPAPLVSQWKEELKSKFGLDIPSTDDADYRSGDGEFWARPFVLASINQAKSQKISIG